VADAGYYGYDLMLERIGAGVSFLIRMSSTVPLSTEEQTPLTDFCEGLVYYWPDRARRKGLPPVQARLWCVRDRKRKVDVWLLTDLKGRLGSRRRGRFSERLKECCREHRARSSPKATRSWPRRKDHKPPGPPKILKLTAAQKRLISRIRKAA
jgi:hypothetical protein